MTLSLRRYGPCFQLYCTFLSLESTMLHWWVQYTICWKHIIFRKSQSPCSLIHPNPDGCRYTGTKLLLRHADLCRNLYRKSWEGIQFVSPFSVVSKLLVHAKVLLVSANDCKHCFSACTKNYHRNPMHTATLDCLLQNA